jgi:membrane-associated phospholipid phosphatase
MLSFVLSVDLAIQAWIVAWPRAASLDALMLGVSGAGWHGGLFLILAAAFAWRRRGLALMGAWRVLLSLVLSGLVVGGVLKPAFARDRPFIANPGSPVVGPRSTGFSFPSGHAADAVAGACALGYLWPRRRLWGTIAALICVSRLYLGVHYPLDVLAGALVGWACAYVATAATPARRPAAAT